MGWRRPELISKVLAATAFEENEVEQAAGKFLREWPFQFHSIGLADQGRALGKQRLDLPPPLAEISLRKCANNGHDHPSFQL
jgi:hypothetical protein